MPGSIGGRSAKSASFSEGASSRRQATKSLGGEATTADNAERAQRGGPKKKLDAARLLKELARRDTDAAAIAAELAFESSAEVTQLTDLIDRLALGEVSESKRSRASEEGEGEKSDGSSATTEVN